MTPKQAQCLDLIKRLTVEGVSPSYEELRLHMGLTSKGEVYRLVHSLAERGVIAISPRRKRCIRVRNEHAEAIPFDRMAEAVAELVASGGRFYPSQIRKVLIEAYAGVI